MPPDVIIVGGGVIGLSIAYALAREGLAATVFEAGSLPGAASWAGAGIISPGATIESADPPTRLRTLSARLHAEWAESLRSETGIDNGYRRCGGLDLALNPEEDAELAAIAARWRAEGIAFERLGSEETRRIEPAVSDRIHAAYLLPGRAQIRNPRHLRALAAACEARKVRIEVGTVVSGLGRSGSRVSTVHTTEGPRPCGAVVVAAGAWSGRVFESLAIPIPTPPVKGQIVLLRVDRPLLGRIVEHGKNYLVPRDDGRILVGATEEDAGFDAGTTARAVRDLLDEAMRLCPALATAAVERSWAGLRPGSIDGRPVLGRVDPWENLYVATGHRRAGLQLSTGTAAVIADLVLGRRPPFALDPFLPGRTPGIECGDAFRS